MIDITQFNGHTAGPWSVGPAGTVYDADGGVVSECFRDARHAGTARSDVSLIASAPDLLAEVIRLRAEVERQEHQASQADQIDVRGIVDALSWMGVSTPEGGTEAAAARLGRLVNDLSAAVLRHKMDHRDKNAEIEKLRAALDAPTRWQPIATAPKDGTWILVAGGSCTFEEDGNSEYRAVSAQFTHYLNGQTISEGRWQFAWYDGGFYGDYHSPTHWMPIPDAPAAHDGFPTLKNGGAA